MRRFAPLAAVVAAGVLLGTRENALWSALRTHDTGAHVVGAGVLAIALRRAFPQWTGAGLFAACLAAVLALEAVQVFVPGRTADVADVLAGAAGAALGLVVSGRRRRTQGD